VYTKSEMKPLLQLASLEQPGQSELTAALATLRHGYPERPLTEQNLGSTFRTAAKVLTDALASATRHLCGDQPLSVAMNWPSGAVFAQSYVESGATSLYHVHFHRDPEELTTVIDVTHGSLEDGFVVIVEPMLATANTVLAVITHCLEQGIPKERLIVTCIIAAPEGLERLWHEHPSIPVVSAVLDQGVDEFGFIVPGLGDFPAKFFANFSAAEEQSLDDLLLLPTDLSALLHSYIHTFPLHETLVQLVVRDHKDSKIAETMRKQLEEKGARPQVPGHRLEIDTGQVEGVENVVAVIQQQLALLPRVRLVAIEGVSGVGKSTTTRHLQEKIGAHSFSLGEVFRYIAYCGKKSEAPSSVVRRLEYRVSPSGLQLFDGNFCVTTELGEILRSKEIENLVPGIASTSQPEVIQFVSRALAAVRDSHELDRSILLEGRGYTLDFLPSDLRIVLTADAVIRAGRRLQS
jgi:cytidylate kinase